MAAAAVAAAAAALGLRDEEDEEANASEAGEDPDDPAGWEEDSDFEEDDDPPLNKEAIKGLKAEFRSSLERDFGYSEISAEVILDKLGLNEPADLLLTRDSDIVLESACNNLIRGANNYAMDDKKTTMQSMTKHQSFAS
jgi:hypothetical protein